jgi:hypothetical protein
MVEDAEPVVGRYPKYKPGRPSKLNEDQKSEVFDAFCEYIVNTPDPTVSRFVSNETICFRYNILDHDIYHWPAFSQLIKRAIKKQEAYLLEQGGAGKYNPTLAIFRLKQPQHGYKDRVDTDITSGGDKLGVGLSAEQAEQLIAARANRSDI